MNPVEYIRSKKFKLSQASFAAIAGVSQPTVSRWETGSLEPNRDEMERIRCKAPEYGIAWEDRWFFEEPPPEEVGA